VVVVVGAHGFWPLGAYVTTGLPFQYTSEPVVCEFPLVTAGKNPVPLIVSVALWLVLTLPPVALAGETKVIVGSPALAACTTNWITFDVSITLIPCDGLDCAVPGVSTKMFTVPAVASSALGTCAASSVELIAVVVSTVVVPPTLHSTTELLAKLLPSTVSVNAPPPAFAPEGERNEIVEENEGVPSVVLKSLHPAAHTAAATPSSNIHRRSIRNRSFFSGLQVENAPEADP
jgi:hypothetical protein